MNKLLRKPLVKINDTFGKLLGSKIKKVPYSRPSTLKAKEIFGDKPIRVIEIGCAAGNNALDILKNLNVSEYVVIDPYETLSCDYDDYTKTRLTKMRKQSRMRLKNYEENITWLYEKSDEALKELEGTYDYIYIDGNHDYEYVLSDMNNYFSLLSGKYVFGGHDIDQVGVSKAFVEFAANKAGLNYKINDPDWVLYSV